MKRLAILKNYQVKLTVFIIAIFIWFYVITEDQYDYVIKVPVSVTNLSDNKVILNNLPKTVKVKVNGTGKSLIALSMGSGANVQLDLSDVEKSKVFKLTPQQVFLTRRFEDVQIQEIVMPETIRVTLDNFISKKVPVHLDLNPQLAAGYTIVGPIQVKPDSVLISGPQSAVSKITEMVTEHKEYNDLRFDLQKKIALKLSSNAVHCNRRDVSVFINIQQLLEITMDGVPVKVTHVPRHLNVYVVPSTVSVVLEGGGLLLSKITRDDIQAYIDYNIAKRNPGKGHAPEIDLPAGIRYSEIKPKSFKLVFENTY